MGKAEPEPVPNEQDAKVNSLRQVVTRLFRLSFGILILAYLFSIIPTDKVFIVLRSTNLSLVFTAAFLSLCVQFILAMRLKILTDIHYINLSNLKAFEVNLVTRFYGLFFPGGSAAAMGIRIYKLAQIPSKYSEAITAVALDRTIATLMTAFTGIVFWVIAKPSGQLIWFFIMLVLFLGIFAVLAIFYLWRPIFKFRANLTFSSAISNFLKSMQVAADQAREMSFRDKSRVLALTTLANILGIFCFAALLLSLDLNLGIINIGWIRSAMLLSSLVPLSISGIGIREGATVLIFQVYGIAPEASLAYSLLVFTVVNLGVGLIGGILEATRSLLFWKE